MRCSMRRLDLPALVPLADFGIGIADPPFSIGDQEKAMRHTSRRGVRSDQHIDPIAVVPKRADLNAMIGVGLSECEDDVLTDHRSQPFAFLGFSDGCLLLMLL